LLKGVWWKPYYSIWKYYKSSSNTWHDHEVPGMILLCDLKEDMQLDHSKDMSV